ncbi:MAG TPA: zinc ribbon domain-containing protein [Ktedonobacterales bacterium]|nr:zinc ribbon domain-containing protein [Ktedonobacterales bacterium]
MQQFCNNCGTAIQPGSSVCSNCGTPVSGGSGAYDPTMRAGMPPSTGYGSQPYGGPPPNNYGAGAPPPPPQGFGSQPYGGPSAPPPGFAGQPYGGPPPMMPVQAPPQKKSRTLWYVLGGIAVILVVCCIGGVVAANAGLFALGKAVNTAATQIAQTENAAGATPTTGGNQSGPFTQSSTTGTHITKIQTGTGWDQNSGDVQGETGTFNPGDTVYTVFTVDLAGDTSATVEIKYFLNGSPTDTSGPQSITESNVYSYNSSIGTDPGIYTIEVDYNNVKEATITVDVVG